MPVKTMDQVLLQQQEKGQVTDAKVYLIARISKRSSFFKLKLAFF